MKIGGSIKRRLSATALTASLAGGLLLAPVTTEQAAAAPGPDDIPGPVGQWSALEDWPLIAIHAALDTEGRVLTYGTNGDGTQTGQFIYDVWTPDGGAAQNHMTLANTTQTDLFCSLQINRPDTGTMLLFGGDEWGGARTTNVGNADINEYNPTTMQIGQLPGMHRQRWYGTGTTLPDGSIFVQGGDLGDDHPELWQPQTGSVLLDHLDTSGLSWWYPRNFVLPDGRLFGVDILGRMYFVSADLSTLTMAGQLGPDRWGYGTTAVMFEPGRILHFGGESATAIIIDVTGPNPVITPTSSLSAPREWVNATLLPDGRVLATGGAQTYTVASDNSLPLAGYNQVDTAEIWDPATGTWTVETSGQAARLYHSTALLLPDGRVLVAGGGAPGPVANVNAEIFSPDYLTTSTGAPIDRPVITGATATDLAPGQALTLTVDSPDVDIARVTLVKAGSVTHSVNMGQRFSELNFTATGGADQPGPTITIDTTIPANPAEVTPGYYLLTVLTSEGVPSESTMVRIAGDPVIPDVLVPTSEVDAQIIRLYRAYFLRNPDGPGLAYWRSQVLAGVSLAEVSQAFAGSQEFADRYGALDDAAFIDLVYTNVLGRLADDGGRAYWLATLADGASRGSIMLSFSESAEFIQLTGTGAPYGGVPVPPPPPPAPAPPPAPGPAPDADPVPPGPPAADPFQAEVRRLYLAYFQREPDQGGLGYWAGARAEGTPLDTVSQAFAESVEFDLAYGALDDGGFIDLVYANVLGRVPEPGGRAFWIDQLVSGDTRGQVMVGFSESAEFITLTGIA